MNIIFTNNAGWIQNIFLTSEVLVFMLATDIVGIETTGKDSKETWETSIKIS